jgi:hypothetical protein
MIVVQGQIFYPVVMIERVWLKDSVMLVYTIETGQRAMSLIPYN